MALKENGVKVDVSSISLYDYYQEGIHDKVYSALIACIELRDKFSNLNCKIEGLETKQDTMVKVINDLVGIHANLLNQINPLEPEAIIEFKLVGDDDTVSTITTTMKKLREQGLRLKVDD